VTLVHAHERLVPAAPVKLHTRLHTWLTEHKVTTILNDRVVLPDRKAPAPAVPGSLITVEVKEDKKEGDAPIAIAIHDEKELKMVSYATGKSGTVDADLLLVCAGSPGNSGFMTRHFGTAILPGGRLKVDESFLVQGTSNIFAVGDVSNADPCPLAGTGKEHPPVLIANLATVATAFHRGSAVGGLKSYTPGQYLWGPGTCLGPDIMVVCIPLCCCTPLFGLAGSKKTEFMVMKPGPAPAKK